MQRDPNGHVTLTALYDRVVTKMKWRVLTPLLNTFSKKLELSLDSITPFPYRSILLVKLMTFEHEAFVEPNLFVKQIFVISFR